jgi:hypothetical protein
MDRNKINERLELALRPAEKPPTLEEVLKQVSRRGVLRGPVDWVFPAWMLYVEYATQKIAEAFRLSEEERRQLLDFRDTVKRLLREAWTQAKEKLAALYKAVVEGTYRLEGNRLYAPDGTWMYVRENSAPRVLIHGVSASARFPDLLKLSRERLELLQLGWRASDEGETNDRSVMNTTQPWQAFAWAAVRYGELYTRIASVNLTHKGTSIMLHLRANGWRQKWGKAEAVDLVASHLKRGEWTPLLTMWLGDGKAERKKVLHGNYKLIIVTKEPWRLGTTISEHVALVATRKEAFAKLREVAGVYGVLLDILQSYKWVVVKLATDNAFKAAYRKRGIDVLREAYKHNNDKIPTEWFSHTEANKLGAVVVAGILMSLHLFNSQVGSLLARRYVRDARRALAIAGRLESAGLTPNVGRTGNYYVVYIAMSDLLKLAEKDDAVRRAIALYLAEKAKNGTPRQREIAEKILKRHPLFSIDHFAAFSMSS